MSAGHGRRNVDRVTSAKLLTDASGRVGEVVHGLPFRPRDTGRGHGAATVGKVRAPAEPPHGYHHATRVQTVEYVSGITGDQLRRVVDERRNPPVTLGVRLVSVVSDDPRHAGQAASVRGLPPR